MIAVNPAHKLLHIAVGLSIGLFGALAGHAWAAVGLTLALAVAKEARDQWPVSTEPLAVSAVDIALTCAACWLGVALAGLV